MCRWKGINRVIIIIIPFTTEEIGEGFWVSKRHEITLLEEVRGVLWGRD